MRAEESVKAELMTPRWHFASRGRSDILAAMLFFLLPAQLLRRPTTVWGELDANQSGSGAGYESLLAGLLILVLGSLLLTLGIAIQKWLLLRRVLPPESFEEFEALEHYIRRGERVLLVASQVAAPVGAIGSFVLGQGYELVDFGLPTAVLACSLPTFLFGVGAWMAIGRLRIRLEQWRLGLGLRADGED